MFKFNILVKETLLPGYTLLGNTDVPGVSNEFYIHLDFSFIFWHRKVAWKVV